MFCRCFSFNPSSYSFPSFGAHHVCLLASQLSGSRNAAALLYQLDGSLQAALLLELLVYQPLQLLSRGAAQGKDGRGCQISGRQVLTLHGGTTRFQMCAVIQLKGARGVRISVARPCPDQAQMISRKLYSLRLEGGGGVRGSLWPNLAPVEAQSPKFVLL